MRYAIILGLAVMLAGCAGSNYQPGDITSGALELQARYCAETDPRERAVRLAVLRAAGVPVPVSGACTDVLELVPEKGLDVDVEQAERDRERFSAE